MTKSKLAATGLALFGLLSASAPALAQPALSFTTTNYGAQVLDPFGGFDWNSAGTAVAPGFVEDGATVFTTEYWADAVSVKRTDGTSFLAFLAAAGFNPSNLVPQGAEFTINALINETAVAAGANSSTFTAVGGSFNIYYDALANAVLATGAGITDGTLILSGSILPGHAGTFTTSGTGGIGDFGFTAIVGYTNPLYISPDLLGTHVASTIQFGAATTNWTDPTSVPGANGATDPLPNPALHFQADANQSFSIPEPGTIALMGIALAGLVGSRRRRATT